MNADWQGKTKGNREYLRASSPLGGYIRKKVRKLARGGVGLTGEKSPDALTGGKRGKKTTSGVSQRRLKRKRTKEKPTSSGGYRVEGEDVRSIGGNKRGKREGKFRSTKVTT